MDVAFRLRIALFTAEDDAGWNRGRYRNSKRNGTNEKFRFLRGVIVVGERKWNRILQGLALKSEKWWSKT
jgi:hypothetical protein